MTIEGGVSHGVTHRDRDDERNSDHRREVIGEPHFVTDRLEPQCDRLGRPTEYRSRDGIRQTDSGGSNSGWEQLGLYHRTYRRITGHDQPRRGDQDERAAGTLFGL